MPIMPHHCHHAPVAGLSCHLDSLKFYFLGNVQSSALLVVVNLGGNTHQLVDEQDRPTPKLGSSSKTIHPLPLLWHFNSVDLEMALYITTGLFRFPNQLKSSQLIAPQWEKGQVGN